MSEQTTETNPEQVKTVEYVCIGQRITSDGKCIVAWLPVDLIGLKEDEVRYWTKTPRGQMTYPGMRIMFRANETGGAVFDVVKQLGTWPDEAKLAAWRIQDRAARVQADAKSAVKKLAGIDYLVKLLAPITKVYRMANRRQRAAMLAVIVTILEGGTVE